MAIGFTTRTFLKKDLLWYIYCACICLYIYASADLLWLDRFPLSVICLLTIIVSSVKIFQLRNSITSHQFILCGCFFVFFYFSFFLWSWGGKFFFLSVPALFLFTVSILLLPVDEKKQLLRAISKCMVIIIIISVPAWILFLAGYDLPHSDVIYHPNGFHEYYDYRFFRYDAKNDNVIDLILPRFQSMFLEPGQFATPCVFLFFLNGARFNRKNLPFIIGIILSFSLVGLVLFFGSIIARKIIIKEKYLFIKFLLIAVFLGGVAYYFTQYIEENNPANKYVFSRLEYDEDKGVSGNNRTSSYFERKYQKFLQSSDRYFGIKRQLKEGYDWTYNCSGYKKFIVNHGLIGFGLFMFFVLLLFFFNRSKPSLFFLVIVVTAFFVRDLLQSPLWLSIAIVGFTILNTKTKEPVFVRNKRTLKTPKRESIRRVEISPQRM